MARTVKKPWTAKLTWTGKSCIDQNGREWKIPFEQFKQFKYAGFPPIPEHKVETIRALFNNITEKNKKETIIKMIEAFLDTPIADLFPPLEQ